MVKIWIHNATKTALHETTITEACRRPTMGCTPRADRTPITITTILHRKDSDMTIGITDIKIKWDTADVDHLTTGSGNPTPIGLISVLQVPTHLGDLRCHQMIRIRGKRLGTGAHKVAKILRQ